MSKHAMKPEPEPREQLHAQRAAIAAHAVRRTGPRRRTALSAAHRAALAHRPQRRAPR
jgi:hypothetical protein